MKLKEVLHSREDQPLYDLLAKREQVLVWQLFRYRSSWGIEAKI